MTMSHNFEHQIAQAADDAAPGMDANSTPTPPATPAARCSPTSATRAPC
jgi:hypothetical protein